MINCPKQVRKPVVWYTDQPQQRATTIHAISKGTSPKKPPYLSSILEPKEKVNFDELLGGKINIALLSSSSSSACQPSTPLNTVILLSIITPKRTLKLTPQPDQAICSISRSPTTRLLDLNVKDISNAAATVQEDQHRQYMDMDLYVCWDSIPELQLYGSFAMWSVLMLALEHSYTISTQKLEFRNTIQWRVSIPKLMAYSEIQIGQFSFDGMYLLYDQQSCALKLLNVIFVAWMNPKSSMGPVHLWHSSESHKYPLCGAMCAILDLLSYEDTGS
ncbi:hypothetical protein DSO57_1025981 [Entomophthora muscae]|uniref:Uncharacterized protein n=1 Tax=Entomophthora muscae TaxID=34485 RepID=A0ACC2UBV4_9FUNG|nr:hypothetical protein DSO57_1025981 [Entomophthora muscae]